MNWKDKIKLPTEGEHKIFLQNLEIMEKLINLFNDKNFDLCNAKRIELGFISTAFKVKTPKEAFEWLQESKDNSIEFIHNLWSDKPIIKTIKLSDLN